MNRFKSAPVFHASAVIALTLLPFISRGVPEGPDFHQAVRSILAKHCVECHGPDEGSRKAGLRLDRREFMTAERRDGIAVVPGEPSSSLVFGRITSKDPDDVMPPPDHGDPLGEEEIDIIHDWIKAGAEFPEHWAFVSPQRSLPPEIGESQAMAPIDRFVEERLVQTGLSLQPSESPAVLLRRLALDLTGLPPDPSHISDFEADHGESNYRRWVEYYLSDPAFGERWATQWLDLARFADTKGFEKDLRRTVWRYRDWVINAFNADMPYDDFTRAQLAGDLLPHGSDQDLLATAFHRNTMTNDEGGTDDEEWRIAAVKDRVDTTFQVWMGLTAGCAKCHSHKYDPISHREYYQLFAFFNQTQDNDRFDESPKRPFPTAGQKIEERTMERSIDHLRDRLEAVRQQNRSAYESWLDGIRQTLKREGFESADAIVEEQVAGVPREIAAAVLAGDIATVAAFFWSTIHEPSAQLHRQIEEKEKKLADLRKHFPMIPVLLDLPEKDHRVTRIHQRGNFLDQGETVGPATPEAFHQFDESWPKNRLGLAEWIVSPRNPLTARVQVNRVWARFFGRGLVETEEDFGTQGVPPSHPRLLDWLAAEFMAHDWSIKWLCREIATSRTYRQSAKADEALLNSDPENRLLSRGPRFRLSGEAIRDSALMVSGLLSREIGGPSVFPHQPDGIWKPVYSQDKWVTSPGDGKWKRGLYTFIRRTSPYPAMLTFDGSSRESCQIRRIRSNTPLQALTTLNDPVYIEAAQALARNTLTHSLNGNGSERIEWIFRRVVSRSPSPEEAAVISELLAKRLDYYQTDSDSAVRMATDPLGPLPENINAAEAAAWTNVANVLLNLDEFLNKP